jgi:hypothetical protein
MTCGELRDFTAAFSMAAPRNNQLREGNCHPPRPEDNLCDLCGDNGVGATLFQFAELE